MTLRTVQAVFAREEDMLRAAQAAKNAGWAIVDVYTPYPVHGIDAVMGLRRSRMPRAAFVFGFLGLALAELFQYWTSTWDWPLNVGGRPRNSWPAFFPVAFEMMILCAGLGMVFTFFVLCRLYPGKNAESAGPRVTDDQFVLEVREPGAGADVDAIVRLFEDCHAGDRKVTGGA